MDDDLVAVSADCVDTDCLAFFHQDLIDTGGEDGVNAHLVDSIGEVSYQEGTYGKDLAFIVNRTVLTLRGSAAGLSDIGQRSTDGIEPVDRGRGILSQRADQIPGSPFR